MKARYPLIFLALFFWIPSIFKSLKTNIKDRANHQYPHTKISIRTSGIPSFSRMEVKLGLNIPFYESQGFIYSWNKVDGTIVEYLLKEQFNSLRPINLHPISFSHFVSI
ncbi:hypothetical protein [Sphingobacterium endophyticum]|uniref:hypothetical protein n=1 Tax=Sphingobacterium endophyticum TaxID=2546448 RepID=UPI0012E109AE|nr:hypothetical protein [Sphingobacterium endophyticum]